MKRFVTGAAMALAMAAGFTQTPQTSDAGPNATQGRRAYISFCQRCHGINLVATSSAYYDLRTFPKDDKARFIDSVTNGKRQMPAWGSIVKPNDIESIWLYIGGVNGW